MVNLSLIKRVYQSSLFRKISIDYIGQVITSGFGFLISIIILPIKLGPEDFGILSLTMAVFETATLITDLGISHAMIRFASLYLEKDRPKAEYIFKICFFLRIGISTAIVIIGALLAGVLATAVYKKPYLEPFLRLGFYGILGATLWSFFNFALQAREMFKHKAILNIAVGFVRFGVVLILLLANFLTIKTFLWLNVLITLFGFCLGTLFTPRSYFRAKGDLKAELSPILKYSFWTGILIVCDTLFVRLDTLMLGFYTNDTEVGYYNVAFNFILIIYFINQSIMNVLFPYVSKITAIAELKIYARRIIKVTSLVALLFLPGFLLIDPLTRLLYSHKYDPSILIFQILYIGIIFDLITHPLFLILYSLNKPNILAYSALIKLVLHFIGNVILIPLYQAQGAAIATIITRIIGGAIALLILRTYFKRVQHQDGNLASS